MIVTLIVFSLSLILLANSSCTVDSAGDCLALPLDYADSSPVSVTGIECFNKSTIQVNWTNNAVFYNLLLYLRCNLTSGASVLTGGAYTYFSNIGSSRSLLMFSYPSTSIEYCEVFGCWAREGPAGQCDKSRFIPHNNQLQCREPVANQSSTISSNTSSSCMSSVPVITATDITTLITSFTASSNTVNATIKSSTTSNKTMTTTSINTATHVIYTTPTHTITDITSTTISINPSQTSSSSPSPTDELPNTNRMLLTALIIALVAAVLASGLIVCSFTFVVFMMMCRMKKEWEIPEITTEIDILYHYNDANNGHGFNPPPRPFSQPRSIFHPRNTLSSDNPNYSIGDDSVFDDGVTAETIGTNGEKVVRDSGFEESERDSPDKNKITELEEEPKTVAVQPVSIVKPAVVNHDESNGYIQYDEPPPAAIIIHQQDDNDYIHLNN